MNSTTGRRTVRDLVDIPGHLYPVGRPDKTAWVLMLLTNDGDLAHKLTHPSFGTRNLPRLGRRQTDTAGIDRLAQRCRSGRPNDVALSG